MNAPTYIPSEENFTRVLRGELPDPCRSLSTADVEAILASGRCPREGRVLESRDNPRHPGLNRELFCSCGFAFTT